MTTTDFIGVNSKAFVPEELSLEDRFFMAKTNLRITEILVRTRKELGLSDEVSLSDVLKFIQSN